MVSALGAWYVKGHINYELVYTYLVNNFFVPKPKWKHMLYTYTPHTVHCWSCSVFAVRE